jgi:hypothetical protein
MPTSQFVSPIDCDTDANFQAWGGQISAQLAAIGLTKTADTGQINWASASVGSYGGTGIVGYEIWAFNDANQAGNPIFFKLEYGAFGANHPELQLTVGQGSDGAGNITGTLKSNAQLLQCATTLSNAYPSYMCYRAADGFLGVALKAGMQGNPGNGLGFCISRTNDTTGAVTGDAFNVQLGAYSDWRQETFGYTIAAPANLKFPTSGNFMLNPPLAMWPYGLTSSYAGGNIQAQPVFALAPAIQVDAKRCVALLSEVPLGTSFSLAVVGSTPRTFIQTGGCLGLLVGNQNSPNWGTCMLWES